MVVLPDLEVLHQAADENKRESEPAVALCSAHEEGARALTAEPHLSVLKVALLVANIFYRYKI